MVQQWFKNGSKMVKNDPEMIPKLSTNDFLMVQNVPKWSKNGLIII